MKEILIVLAAATVAALAPTTAPAAGPTGSGEVTSWIDVTLDQIAAHRTNPLRASRGLALLSVAMAEAASAGSPAAEAAVAGAASTVLAHLYPQDSGRFHGLANARAGAGGRGPLEPDRDRIGRGATALGEHDSPADEAALSRLYGGIHFRSDNDAGLELGRAVAAAALAKGGAV